MAAIRRGVWESAIHGRRFATAVCLAGFALSDVGRAQQTAGSEDQLAEVVVTATHIRTSESTTPLSMEVLGQDELQLKGVHDVQTLIEHDPSLNFDTGNGAGWITLRGISGAGGSGAGAVGAAVPIAFDGFYYNLNYIFNDSLYDVDRIEVLRGPQGTLFGRNASGGLINVVSNDPGHSFEGYFQVGFGNYNALNLEGALNLPVSDAVQIRFSGSSSQHSGYRKLIYGMGAQVDDQDSKSGRVKVAIEPNEHLRILASLQFTHVGGAGPSDYITNLPADPNNLPTHAAIPLTSREASVYNLAFASQVAVDDRLFQLHIDYDDLPGGMMVTYLGGYSRLDYLHTTPVVGVDAAVYGIPTTIGLLTQQNPRTQNHEFRLVSASDQAVTWQAGAFYYRSTMANNDSHFRDEATPDAPDLVAFLYSNKQTSTAGYGQADWHLGPTTLSAGARYTSDYVGQTDKLSPGDGIFPALADTQYNKWTWHIGEDWKITPRNLLYIKADTGYRAGAFNLSVPCNCDGGPPQPSVVQPFAPEYVRAYEFGSKNRLLDQRLLLNGDLFFMRYSGQQLPESNQGGAFTVNAGTTNIYGMEGQLAAIVNPVGRFDLNLTWLHARFNSQVFTNALLQQYNIGSNYLLQSPRLSLDVGYEHDFRLGSATLTGRVDTKYQSGQYFDFYNFPDSYQSGYTRTDVHLIYKTKEDKWNVDAYVRNVENARVIADETESFAPPLTQPGTYNVGFQSPRTYGVTLTSRF